MRFLYITLIMFSALCCYAQDIVPMHNDKGQFGYGIKGSKEFTIKPQWDEAKPFNENGIAIVRKGKNFGIINKSGEAIGKVMGYSLITPFDGTDLFLVAEGGNRVDDVRKIKTRQSISPYGFKGSLSYPINGAKWGLVKSTGEFQIEPKYQEISSIMENGFLVVQLKGLLGIIDIDGNIIFDTLHDVITPINNQGIAAIRNKKTQKWSLISKEGKTIIGDDVNAFAFYQFNNDHIGTLNQVSADSVLRNKKLCSETGFLMPIMTFGYSWINSKHPYIVATRFTKQKKNNIQSIGVYDINGNNIIPFSAELTYSCVPSDGIAVAYRGEQCGFYNINSKTFTMVENRNYLPFRKGLSLSFSNDNNDFYLVDSNGNRKTEKFDNVLLSDDRFIVNKGPYYGIITIDGEQILPVEFMSVGFSGDGIFAVKDNTGAFGYLDKNGNVLIPLEYADGTNILNGHAVVSKKISNSVKKTYGVINLKNEVVIPFNYENIVMELGKNDNLIFWVQKGGKFYEYNISNAKLTSVNYVDMKMTDYGIIIKNENEKYGLIVSGQEIIPCSLSVENEIANLYSFMIENNISVVSSSDARSISIRLNPDRNKFKLNERISDNYWDF